jgi:light-regulated signal transduction histidine kinase (bacteriophytochrome)
MGQLIDDLLEFSRLGRKELSHVHVNMDELVQNIVQEFKTAEPHRRINVVHFPLKQSRADSSMIRQVWINLISNAFKYSRYREISEVEIGSYENDNQTCYYVRDNGAGFDMEYEGKLFGVFQRLHKMNEFEGTGVGLALVKTIVKRHGGYVWAEGKLNDGATFYFTLPHEEQVDV